MDATKKVVFVGDVAVGKTSVVHRLVYNNFDNEYSVS